MTALTVAQIEPWLATPSGAQALSELLLLWTVVIYITFGNKPAVTGTTDASGATSRWHGHASIAVTRAVLLLIGVLVLFRPSTPSTIALTIAFAAWAGIVTRARGVLGALGPTTAAKPGAAYAAELEIIATAMTIAAAAVVVELCHAQVTPLVILPLTEARVAVLAAIASTYLFAVCAGAHIVRGALAKGGSLPTHARRIVDAPTKMVVDTPTAIPAGRRDADAPVGALDSVEYNRGRLIGMIERMLLITLVAAGSFDALAFIIAAKSLIRSKELEHRDFAEYFLIGTLTSVALALPLGLLVQKLIKHW